MVASFPHGHMVHGKRLTHLIDEGWYQRTTCGLYVQDVITRWECSNRLELPYNAWVRVHVTCSNCLRGY